VANTDTPILDMMSYSWGILSGSFLAPYMLALYHKGMTRVSAWAGMLTGFCIALVPAVCKILTLSGIGTEGIIKTLSGYGPQFACGAMILSFVACFIAAPISRKFLSETNDEFYFQSGIKID